MRRLGLTASLLLLAPSTSSASPALEMEIARLQAELDRAQRELAELKRRRDDGCCPCPAAARPPAQRFEVARTLELSSDEALLAPHTAGGRRDGFYVWSVTPGGYLASAGLKSGDILVEVNRRRLRHEEGERILAAEWSKTRRLSLVVERAGRETALTPIVERR
jgi:hypothetical protein